MDDLTIAAIAIPILALCGFGLGLIMARALHNEDGWDE